MKDWVKIAISVGISLFFIILSNLGTYAVMQSDISTLKEEHKNHDLAVMAEQLRVMSGQIKDIHDILYVPAIPK